jgi:CheY-like chemotaxis protein
VQDARWREVARACPEVPASVSGNSRRFLGNAGFEAALVQPILPGMTPPADDSGTVRVRLVRGPVVPPAGGPWTFDVLVVDDDDSLRRVLETAIRRAGYRVTSVASGKEAVALLSRQACRLILTDLFMPDGDGIEVLLSVMGTGLRVITLSGSLTYDPALMQRIAIQFGACRTLNKPCSLSDLLAAIRQEIGEPMPAAPLPGDAV